MKLHVLSIGRRIAIAVCAVLALATGTLSVIYPRLAAFSAAAAEYDSLNVESHLTVLERGLNDLDPTYKQNVWDQLESSLDVKGVSSGIETPLENDEFSITQITYNANNTATIEVHAGAAVGEVNVPVADAVVGSVVVGVDTEKAVRASWHDAEKKDYWVEDPNGIWKVKNASGITNESVFLTDLSKRPISDLRDNYLTYAIKYQNVTVPMTVVGDEAQTLALGQVNSRRIRQKSFNAGNQTIEVSVAVGNETALGKLNVTFEDVKVIKLSASPKSGNIYSYSDVVSSLNVKATYNDGSADVTLSERDFTSPSTFAPTQQNIADVFSGGIESRESYETRRTQSRAPANVAGTPYSKDVTVVAGDVETICTVSGILMGNPYQIIGIVGIPVVQTAGKPLDLSGLSVMVLYVTSYTDETRNVAGVQTIASTTIKGSQTVLFDLENVKDSLSVSFDGGNPVSASEAVVPSASTSNMELTFTYKGQMFYYATRAYYDASVNYMTEWTRNDTTATATHSIKINQNVVSNNNNYYTLPVIDENDVGYREGLTKRILGVDLTNPNAVANGMTVKISNAAGQSLLYTYEHKTENGVTSVSPKADAKNNPAQVGVSYNPTEGVITINKPGSYSVLFTLPEPENPTENNKMNYWTGTEENTKEYSFIVDKGELTVYYTNMTLATGGGLSVPMGSLASSLANIGVLFSASGNLVFESLPTDYVIYIRYADNAEDTAWHVVYANNRALTQAEQNYINNLLDTSGTRYLLNVKYSATEMYMGNQSEENPTTLTVLMQDVSMIDNVTVRFDRGVSATAEQIASQWDDAVEDYEVTVEQNNDGVWSTATGTLHANGEYRIAFAKTGTETHYAKLTVTAVVYNPLTATYGEEVEYSAEFNGLLKNLTDTAKKAISDANVYYILNETASVTYTDSNGTTVTDVKDLTVGTWTAQLETTWANGEEGDYNCPTVSVSFTVKAIAVNLNVDDTCDFTLTSGTNYTVQYGSGKSTFALTGWTAEAKKNIVIGVTGKLHRDDGSQVTIPSNFITAEETNSSYKLTFNTAGIYTVTVRLANEQGNVTGVTETTYTLTVTKSVAAWKVNSLSVTAGSFVLPSGLQFFTVGNIRIANYEIYETEEGGTPYVGALNANRTYYLAATGLTGDYVLSPDGAYSATFTYAENYNLPAKRLAINVTANVIDALIAGSEITNNGISVEYGQKVDILSYFTNALNAEAYVVTVNAAARASLAEQLADGSLPVGTYTVTIDANEENGFSWTNGASATTLTLTISAQEITAPEMTTANGTYNTENQTASFGPVSYWKDYADKGVEATVYWFATAQTEKYTSGAQKGSFDVETGTLTYTDAGYYYVVFSLDNDNYVWAEESVVEQCAAIVSKLELTLPIVTRAWSEGTVSYPATGTRVVNGYTVSYTMSADNPAGGYVVGTTYKVAVTMTGVTKNGKAIDFETNATWVANQDDDLSYLNGQYGEVTGTTAKLNFVVVQSELDITYESALIYYGSYAIGENDAVGNKITDLKTLFPMKGTDATKFDSSAWCTSNTPAWDYTYVDNDGERKPLEASTLEALSAGKYNVTITLSFNAASQYSTRTYSLVLTVSPRPVTLKVDATQKYGQELASVTVSDNEFNGVSFVYALDSQLSVGTHTYGEAAWVRLDNTLANYVITFAENSTLTVEQGDATVSVVLNYVHGQTPATSGTLTADKLLFSADDTDATGTASYTVTKTGETYTITLDLTNLTSANYNLTFDGANSSVQFRALQVRVLIGTGSGNYGSAADLSNVDFTLQATNATLTAEELAAVKTELKAQLNFSTTATATSVVGKYPITASYTGAEEDFVVTSVNGEYTVTFDIAQLNVRAKADLAYTGEALELVERDNPAALDGVTYTVYYSTDADHEHWSTIAQGTNAVDYNVAYCIDIAGFDRIYGTKDISVTIAPGENTLKTPFDLTVNGESKVAQKAEDLGNKIAWTYGNFNSVTVTTPVAEFGGAISYALYKGNDPIATSTDVNALLALHANRLTVGTYRLEVSTSDAANYEIGTIEYYFAIGKAAITFKADDVTVTYGDSARYSYSVSGLNTAAGDTKESILGDNVKVQFVCDYAPGDATNGNVKEDGYVISLNVTGTDGASLDNYTFETADGLLTVVARAITIKIDSITIDYRATQQDNGAALETLTAQLVRGTLPNGVQLTDVIGLRARGLSFNDKEGDELTAAAGTYPIYALWKDGSAAKNYEISFFDCEYAEAHDYSDYIGGGAAHTAGVYTINKLFVNTTWSSATRTFVYNGNPIYGQGVANGLTASATGYVDKNGASHSFTTAKALNLTYEFLENGNYVTGTGAPVNAGTYKIYANLADTNYTTGGSYIIIQIDKATLEVKVDNATMTYGDELPTCSYTIPNLNSLLQADKEEVEGKTFSYAVEGYTGAYNKLPAGTHVLTLADIELTNYRVVVSYGSLTVNRREVRVTLNSFSQPYKGSAYDQEAFDQLLSDLAEKGESPYTVTGMSENGDLADNDTLGITLSIADNALNVNTYNVFARVTHTTNYLVTLTNTAAKFTITPAEIYVQTTLNVTYGETAFTPSYEIGTLENGAFVAGVNGETYQSLYNTQLLLDNVVYVGGAPEYQLVFTAGQALNKEYTVNRLNASTAQFTFMNYTVKEYLTFVNIKQRVLTLIGEQSATYTGKAITPNISFGNVVAGENIPSGVTQYFDENGDAITDTSFQMINAGNYYIAFQLNGNNSRRYAFNANGDTTIKIPFEVLKKVIDLRWDRDSILYDDSVSDSSKANDNFLIGYASDVDGLVSRVFTRTYTIYSTSSEKGEKIVTDGLALTDDPDDTSDYFFYRVRGVGSYTIIITLKEGNEANYAFKDGEKEITLTFSAYANSAKMTVAVEKDKIYDGTAATEEVTIEGPAGTEEEIVLDGYLTKTYALIDADVADQLNALGRKINSNDIRDLGIIFATSTAPVNAGYYVLHVVYFRELSSGSQGADTYVVYNIASRIIDKAPELNADETTSYVYNAQTHTFVITVTDESAIMAFAYNRNWISLAAQARDYSVTIGTTPYVDVTTGYTLNVELNNDGTLLTITVTALNAGDYTVTFHLANKNFVWNTEDDESDLAEGGGGSGIVLNENGDFTVSFSVAPYQIVLGDETSEDTDYRATVNYTRDAEDYLDEIKNVLTLRGLPSFVNLDNVNSVVFHNWREDDNYAGQTPVSGALNVGTYHYSVKIPGTTNYNSPSLTGTLLVNKKTVEVYVNAFTTFGSEQITFDRNSFTFEGFVNGENVWTILSDIFDGLVYHIGTVDDANCYSNGYLNAGTYENILTLEMDENGNIVGFVPSGLQDNYVYKFASGALTVNSYQITVNIGNASSPFGTSLASGLRNVTLTSGNEIFEPYTSLRDLLAVRLAVNDADSTSNAGNYVITATAGNPNYQVSFNSGVYTITPVAVSITLNAGGGTYNGKITGASLGRVSSAESPELTRADIEEYFVYRYTGTSWSGVEYNGFEVPTLAGSYTVTAEIDPERTGNFSLIGSVSAVFEVARMQLDVSKISVEDLVYNGNVQSVIVVDNDYNVDGKLLYTYAKTDAGIVFQNAGTYSITLTVRDLYNTQWSTREGDYVLFFNIAKAQNSVLDVEINEWTYGETANTPVSTVLYLVDGMEVVYEYMVEGHWTTLAPSNAGTYVMRATVLESENYLASAPREKTFTVHQKTVSVPALSVTTSTYTGNTLLASVLGYDATCMTLEYSDISRVDGNTVTLSATNSGKYIITIKLISSVNYKWENSDEDNDGTITLSWTVVPKTLESDPTENTDKFVVDGSILEYIPTGFDPTIMDIVNNEIGHSGKFTVTVSLKDKANYTWSNGSTDDITFEWTVEGVSNIFLGIVGGLAGVAVIAAVALFAQIGAHNRKKKREAAEMENRDSAETAEEGE